MLPDFPYQYSLLDIPENVAMHPSMKAFNFRNAPEILVQQIPFFSPEEIEAMQEEEIFFVPDPLPKITDHGATLGRVLFYDKRLSLNNAVSCASCHLQSAAFADNNRLSPGFQGKLTSRNSMAIVNPFMNQNLFWDSRTQTLNDLILQPVQHHVEMGMESLDYLHKKLAEEDFYPPLFEAAYGSSEITSERISDAVTQFLSSFASFNSKFDEAESNDGYTYSPLERRGREMFFGAAKCSQCHAGPNLAAEDFPGGEYGGTGGDLGARGTANIGLESQTIDPGFNGQFRIPTLRNIELTGPYMHDGRFSTLMEVIDHYNDGVKNHPKLDDKLIGRNGLPQRLGLSAADKLALVEFLRTLTDHQLINDPRFSDPF